MYCHNPPRPDSCSLCRRAGRDPKLRAYLDSVSPPVAAADPPCRFLGDELTGRERQTAGLSHGPRWRKCLNPDQPLGEFVAGCRGCDPSCVGYAVEGQVELPPGGWTRNLIFHFHPTPETWKWHADQLRRRLSLFDGKKVVAITTGAGLVPAATVRAALPGCEFVEAANDPRWREVVTFEPLFGAVAGEPGVTLYGQTKGATRGPRETARRWAEILYETLTDHWPVCESLLRRYPLVGSFLKVGRGWPDHQSKSEWHYSGSWFWFRNADLFAKEWRRIDPFGHAIESYPSLHFPVTGAGCVFHRGTVPQLDLYDWDYFARAVEPELTVWQRANLARRTVPT